MKVYLTPRAQQDLRLIDGYLRPRSRQGAEGIARRMRSAFILLSQKPRAGAATEHSTVRQLFIGRYPYIAYYRLTAKGLEILHIRHTSRHPIDPADLAT